MHVETKHWAETERRQKYVGCIGYDDPVYESYDVEVSKSESYVVFDSGERRAFHETLLSMKDAAYAQLERILLAHERDFRYETAQYDEKIAALREAERRTLESASWLKRIFFSSSLTHDIGQVPVPVPIADRMNKDPLSRPLHHIFDVSRDYARFIHNYTEAEYNELLNLKDIFEI